MKYCALLLVSIFILAHASHPVAPILPLRYKTIGITSYYDSTGALYTRATFIAYSDNVNKTDYVDSNFEKGPFLYEHSSNSIFISQPNGGFQSWQDPFVGDWDCISLPSYVWTNSSSFLLGCTWQNGHGDRPQTWSCPYLDNLTITVTTQDGLPTREQVPAAIGYPFSTDTEFFITEAQNVPFDITVYSFPTWANCGAKRSSQSVATPRYGFMANYIMTSLGIE